MSQEDLKSNDRGGFNRMRPRMDGGGNDPRRGPRFNIYWVWGALAVILLGFNLFSSFSPEAKRINFDLFKEMLAKGDVAKIELVSNKNLVRVYIKPDSLQKPFYKDKLPKGFNASACEKAPQFEFTIAKPEIFTDDLR